MQGIDLGLGHVAVIGHGTVGTWLARALSESGVTSSWLPGRDLGAEHIARCGNDVQIWLLAVPDDALGAVAALLPHQGLRVHFSGATPVDVLTRGGGVVPTLVTWPMASIRDQTQGQSGEVTWLYTEGAEIGKNSAWRAWSAAWLGWIQGQGGRLIAADDQQRARAHVASVFAANYTASILRVAHALSEESGVDWAHWQPMVETSVARMWSTSERQSATGPAARNDRTLLMRQFEGLQDHPGWQDMYGRLADLALEQSGFPSLFHKIQS